MNKTPTDPAAIVEEYLRLHMIPDPDSTRQYCAPGLEIRFTGNRLMDDPAEATAFNKARYKWVKKKFGPTHAMKFKTRSGELWSVPYPQERNDIPMIVARAKRAWLTTPGAVCDWVDALPERRPPRSSARSR